MLRRLLGIVLIVLGIATILIHFNVFAFDMYNIPIISAGFFILFQVFQIIRNKLAKAHPTAGFVVPGVLILISVGFIAVSFIDVVEIGRIILGALVGALMFAEGIYSLH